MPTYEYKCEKCGRFEIMQSIKADPLAECPTCGSNVQRLISRNVNIVFKGPGFHINDYRSDSYNSAAKAERNSSSVTNSSSAASTNTSESSSSKASSTESKASSSESKASSSESKASSSESKAS